MKKLLSVQINMFRNLTKGFTQAHTLYVPGFTHTRARHVSGFTLIEALVAIFIFSLALVSLITITSRGVTGIAQARDQVTAQFLAQEGIEMARNTRDTHFVQFLNNTPPVTWYTDLSVCTQNNPCFVDLNGDNYEVISGSSYGLAIAQPPQVDRYEATSSSDVKFTRQIYYVGTMSADEIQVHSVVTWNNGALQREIHLVTTLTNWLGLNN
ncbi:MAG: prepilin-type N-terminal cleavage/methylation domain-containing protein [Candidatus Pacebacteria bacterium]|nr:prepilin-type N-terminal cleavage/methylation domain-containing protein [Candidatus Paceibacterota bacterium]